MPTVALFFSAVALGYEAALRIGEAVNPSHYRFWHPTGTAATFGAAAPRRLAAEADAAQMLDALGSAGTQAAGLWEFNADGAMSKHLHPGKAAFNGVLAADLARAGFTGATRILEGERGFFRAMSTSYDATRITDGLGTRWKITENCYKLHSCCGHTHSAIDVALALRRRRAHSACTAIRIETYGPGYEIVKETGPARLTRLSSASPTASPRPARRRAWGSNSSPRSDSGRRGARSRDCGAAPRPHAGHSGGRPHREVPCRVAGARRHHARRLATALRGASDFPRGNPENPVSTAELEDKFLSPGGAAAWGRQPPAAPWIAAATSEDARDMAEAVPQPMKDINPRSAAVHANTARPCASCAAGSTANTGRSVEERAGYPEEFVKALTEAGWLAALIPTEYGGGGLGITEASVILEEINRSGANSGACHAQMYIMGTLLRHGSDGAEAAIPAQASRRANCACNPSPSPSRPPEPTPPRSRPSPNGRATATSSTARRSGFRACSTPT